ncbi:hypothetical protein F2Q70_00005285 [Brassica cretica]|uniref:Uncharacterized protein n=1 Tax=Brassica cretica TaxID=69181 RepID=A0A8S9J256_BRACR|nr:hypothetical protein F2Q70_00005285 [Brassica cretica]
MCHLLVVSGEAEVLGGNMKKQIMDEYENLSLKSTSSGGRGRSKEEHLFAATEAAAQTP